MAHTSPIRPSAQARSNLVYQFDWFGNVDAIWEDPDLRVIFEGLASFSRLILHDRRATGLSSRSVPVPDLETRIGDLRCSARYDRGGAPGPRRRARGRSPERAVRCDSSSSCPLAVLVFAFSTVDMGTRLSVGCSRRLRRARSARAGALGTYEYGRALIDTEEDLRS